MKSLRFLVNFLLCCVLAFLANNACAQLRQDTLTDVLIRERILKDTLTDQRGNFTAGQQVQQIDPVYKNLYESQSLAGLLSQQSSVFIKSYGINSMATLSLRGASAAQSSVLWNGVPLLNPALGVADLSLLRTGLFDEVKLQYGSSAALYGSGNVGGALMLDDKLVMFKPMQEASAVLGYGSYGRFDASAQAQWQSNKFRVAVNGFYQKATNDFRYTDGSGTAQQMPNAHLQGGGGLVSLDYNLNKNNAYRHSERLYLKLWLQQYSREIPPALFERYSVKQQDDRSLRTLLGWEKNTRRSTFYAKGSYSREYLHYNDITVRMDNRNTVLQYYQETGWKYYLNNPDKPGQADPERHLLMVYAPVQYAEATGAGIASEQGQFRPALVAAYRFRGWGERLLVNAALRQEWVNGTAAPLLPGIGASLQWPGKHDKPSVPLWIQLRANVQRTYRIPTLNELYYFPGGNPDLKPEQGWSQDAGYTVSYGGPEQTMSSPDKESRIVLSHALNIFNRNIQDWIYWLGGAIWTPHNIAKVHSRGVETSNSLQYRIGDIWLQAGMSYTYVLSTTEASYLPGDGSIGKQIPYTPRYSLQANAGFRWKESLFFNYNQTYTGYRFVTVDESQYLEPYYIANIQAGYHFRVAHASFSIAGQLQNVFGTAYEVVNGRPMPGRNFLLQLKTGLFR